MMSLPVMPNTRGLRDLRGLVCVPFRCQSRTEGKQSYPAALATLSICQKLLSDARARFHTKSVMVFLDIPSTNSLPTIFPYYVYLVDPPTVCITVSGMIDSFLAERNRFLLRHVPFVSTVQHTISICRATAYAKVWAAIATVA